jgi:hypothetical protein
MCKAVFLSNQVPLTISGATALKSRDTKLLFVTGPTEPFRNDRWPESLTKKKKNLCSSEIINR